MIQRFFEKTVNQVSKQRLEAKQLDCRKSHTLDMKPNTLLSTRFHQAVLYASEIHREHTRKGTTIPYISHLLQVCGLVLEFGGTEEEAIGGLLHDAAEDAGGEPILAYILKEFGELVEQIVRENSDSISDTKTEKAPWRQRKESYLAAIATKSPSSLVVSICDKIHNVRALNQDSRTQGEIHWSRFNATKSELLWYFESLLEEFEKRIADEPRLAPAVILFRDEVSKLSSPKS
jgi:(p)ppGpp synthase/HD superfamily hydrolase